MILLFLFKTFFNYYNKYSESLNCFNERKIFNNLNNLYISFCYFYNIKSSNDGGVIYCNYPNVEFLIDFSMFNQCNGLNGGSILFSSYSLILTKCCVYNCSSINNVQFIISNCLNKNNLEFLSILYTANFSIINNNHILLLINGNQIFKNNNLSNCKSYRESGLTLEKGNSFNVIWCNFIKNNAQDQRIIWINYGINNRIIEKINFINNLSPNGGIILAENTNIIIKSSIFNLNTIILFYTINSQISVENCFFNHNGQKLIGNVILISENLLTLTFFIIHFKSHFCYVENPFIFSKSLSLNFNSKIVFLFIYFLYF